MRIMKGYRQLTQFGDSKYLRVRVLSSETTKREIIRVGGKRQVEVTIASCTGCAAITANRGRVCRKCLDAAIPLV